jgi:hypothetical protein
MSISRGVGTTIGALTHTHKPHSGLLLRIPRFAALCRKLLCGMTELQSARERT